MTQENTVGKRLKLFFKEKGLTQVQIAERVGTTQQVVQKLLNGRPFGKHTAAAWSKEFGLNPAWLITNQGEMMLEDMNAQINTTKNVVEIGANAFAEQVLKLISEGTLYPASVVKDKDTIIKSKDEEIQRLNREVGALKQQIEQLQNELKGKSVAQTGAGVA